MGGHHHHHDHHHHAPVGGGHGRAFGIGIALNSGFVAVEATFGFLSGSMALVADAGHNLSDVLSLVIAWVASALVARPPSERFTYGYKSSSILAALANAALLFVALGAIAVETVRRLFEPAPVAGGTVVIVALVGIAINTITALLFMRGRHDDLNIRGAFLHMAGDAAVSAGVVVSGLLIMRTGMTWIDPVTGLIIVGLIAWGTWGLFKDSVRMGLLGVPDGIDHAKVRAFIATQPGVSAVHDLHIWPMSTTETALTAHLVMPGGCPGDDFLHELAHELEHDFGIGHATVQVERAADESCALASEAVV